MQMWWRQARRFQKLLEDKPDGDAGRCRQEANGDLPEGDGTAKDRSCAGEWAGAPLARVGR